MDVATAVFVDRDVELGALHDAFDAARSGEARLVVIEGEAGVGKTTLVERFLPALDPVRVLRASGDESEAHVPFSLADQLLRTGGRASGALHAVSHVAVGLELLELIGDAEPTCVFVDDAHQTDPESLRALLFTARRLATHRVLVVLAVRGTAEEALAEGWCKLAAEPAGRRLVLGGFDPCAIAALGAALGIAIAPDAARRLWAHTKGNPLHARAVLRDLPDDDAWQYEPRPLPVPKSYGQLVRRRLDDVEQDVVDLIEAAAVLGVRAPLSALLELVASERPLDLLDDAIATGLVQLDERRGEATVEFAHPLTRGAVYEAIPTGRRARLNTAAAEIVRDAYSRLRHRIEAATVVDAGLLADLERFAHDAIARGAWSSAIATLLAASRLTPTPADRERFVLAAIEATMYAGDGAGARRLAERSTFTEGPRRDSVLAYLAMFEGDPDAAQRLLARAWEHARDDRLRATIAQRSAFMATSRLRGKEAIAWAERAVALAPGDPATGQFAAPSLALGLSFTGERERAHAALDRWLDHPAAPQRSGFVLLAIKGFLLLGDCDLRAARAAFERSAQESLGQGLLIVAALSLSGLTRVEYLAGAWDSAAVAAERALALAVESDDQWVIGHAHWSASFVPAARGDWSAAERHVGAIRDQRPRFERHIAAEAIAGAGLAAAQGRPADVLRALDAVEALRPAEGVDDPVMLPWQHLKAHALVDLGEHAEARRWIDVAGARSNPLLAIRLAHARARADLAERRIDAAVATLGDARAASERLELPYEQALIEVTLGQILRRAGERRAAAAALVAAQHRLSALEAAPVLGRCESELAACGLAPATRKSRDYTALTPQELAVARLVVSGMTNREVAAELMLSTKTVEFHLSNIYTKVGVRTRSELRARSRANELPL